MLHIRSFRVPFCTTQTPKPSTVIAINSTFLTNELIKFNGKMKSSAKTCLKMWEKKRKIMVYAIDNLGSWFSSKYFELLTSCSKRITLGHYGIRIWLKFKIWSTLSLNFGQNMLELKISTLQQPQPKLGKNSENFDGK